MTEYIVAFHADGKEGMSGVERVNGKSVTFTDIDQAAVAAGTLNQRNVELTQRSTGSKLGALRYEVRKNPTAGNSLGESLDEKESARVRTVYQKSFSSQRRAPVAASGLKL